jgi:hypothetical protein
LEPEAAALAARRARLDDGSSLAMAAGETFIVVDAGGGTVDDTMHKVRPALAVALAAAG